MRVSDLIVEVRDADFERVGQITPQDLVGATFVVRYNNVGTWSITMPQGHPLGELLRLPGYGIILTGPNDEPIMSGPTLSAKLTQTQDNTNGTWEIVGASDDIVLTERLAYPTPTTADVTDQTQSNDVRTGAAETVVKAYVNANIGPSAPVERRISNLVIETDEERGSTVFASARFNMIQELVYDLAQVGGIGYRLTQDDDLLEFSVFEPTDRSDTIRMDIQNRKLSSAVYSYGTAKVTRAIVAGQGVAENRIFVERTNTDSLAAETLWGRRIETFKDARQSSEIDELNTSGDELLADLGKTIVEMSVTPSDDQSMVYGVDWFLGDRVTVVANDIESTAVVTEVGIQIADDGVRVGATVGTPVGIEFEAKLLAKQQDHEDRISNLEKNEFAVADSGGGGNQNHGSHELAELDDVGLLALAGGQFLVYNSTSELWENETLEIAISDVANLQTELDSKASLSHTHAIADVTNLQTELNSKASTSHTHTIANITGLQTELNLKASTTHSHSISDVTGLQAALDEKLAADAIFKAYGSSDSSVNSTTTYTTRSVVGSSVINVGSFGNNGTTITVPKAGIYELSFSFYMTGSSARTNVGVCWAINGTTQNEVSAMNYLRALDGHNEVSTAMTTMYQLNANDQLELRFARLAASGTVNLQGSESVITIKRIG